MNQKGLALSGQLGLICIVLLAGLSGFCPSGQAVTLPAHVDLSFKTTITVEKTFHPLTSGSVVLFPLETHLYNALNDVPDISAFTLNDIQLAAPRVSTSLPYTVVLQLAYKTDIDATAIPLVRTAALTLSQLKDGNFDTIKEPGFTVLSNAIQSDIQNPNAATRTLNRLFFVLRVDFSGSGDISGSDLESIDLDLTLKARAETSVQF